MNRPTGFAAKCRCGIYVGALDAARTDRTDMGKILGEWLFKGMTVEPRFTGTWSVEIESCRCSSQETSVARIPALPISAEDEATVDGLMKRLHESVIRRIAEDDKARAETNAKNQG